MEKYKCEICGKNHTIYRSMEIALPRMLSDMSEQEKEKRVKEFNGFYIVDEETLFANGWINIEVENYNSPFYSWKTWTSIEKDNFLENLEELKTGKIIEFNSKLEEQLPFYQNSKDLKTKTLIQVTNEGIIVEIRADEECKLKEDQAKPITKNRMIEIIQMLNHHPDRKERKKNDKPFKKRLLAELKKVEKKYIKNNKNFAININTETVLFQIVSNKILEIGRNKERGFGLHLSFDDNIEEVVKFQNKGYSKEFDYHYLDEIPTYQIDLGINKKRLEELVKKIVKDVYEEDLERIEIDNFEI